MRGTYGWAEISSERKRELIAAIAEGKPTGGPSHLELDLTDRCNVDCYFCSQMDVRSKEQIPYPRIVEILNELAANGLRTIRLAGGGDPLFHREIACVLDTTAEHDVIIDNITTNGLGLTADVADRLVRQKCREVLISLNAADADDYARMMQVKPAIFDKVIANVRHLTSSRTAGYPGVVLQFLLDRGNYAKLPEMYRLGQSTGADVLAINVVYDIPLERIDGSVLLRPEDAELLRPYLEEVVAADKDAGLLQVCFPWPEWNAMLAEIQQKVGVTVSPGFTTAASFTEENGKCFFAWYTAVIRGNGDLYPCCLLLNPEYKPLGNAMTGSFLEQWQGPTFTRMRTEMREVFLTSGRTRYAPERFQTLRSECVEPYRCWLKTIYFRGDDDFYRELGEALDVARRREVRWVGTPVQILRKAEIRASTDPRFRAIYDGLRERSRPLRRWLKRRIASVTSSSGPR